jgi:streptogramin lyase
LRLYRLVCLACLTALLVPLPAYAHGAIVESSFSEGPAGKASSSSSASPVPSVKHDSDASTSLSSATTPDISASPGSTLGGSLVVPGSIVEPEQRQAQAEVQHTTPQAFRARERSRTAFVHLDAAEAAKAAGSSFPTLIDEPAGGAPKLPRGTHLVKYTSPTAAQIELPGGKRGAIESLGPMATPAADGKFSPVDLALRQSGDDYRPVTPAVAVEIPRQLGQGVTAEAGVGLVPTDAAGTPLSGAEGTLQDDTSVLYPNSQTDTDTVVKPTGTGFEISAVLRSESSPRTLYYEVKIPAGARLVQKRDGSVAVVWQHHRTLGQLTAPSAQDASGAAVPVTMTVDGDSLVVHVEVAASQVQWPIAVDPGYAEDTYLPFPEECGGVCAGGMGPWVYYSDNPAITFNEGNDSYGAAWYYQGGDYAALQYQTQGQSKIYAWQTETNLAFSRAGWVNIESLGPAGEVFNTHNLISVGEYGGYAGEYEGSTHGLQNSMCGYVQEPGTTCLTTDGAANGAVRLLTGLTEEGEPADFYVQMRTSPVYISQESPPVMKFNTTSSSITIGAVTRPNVLYGSGGWLGPNSGAFQVEGFDPGVGLSAVQLQGYREVAPFQEGKCLGVQCAESYVSPLTYSSTLANGEHTLYFDGEDSVGLDGGTTAMFKVDSTPPRAIGFSGMPETGAEISAAQHTLTIHATDGTTPTKSSGVQSIAVSIDGGAKTIVAGAQCSPGECTGSGSYVLKGESLSEGVHRMTITALDNAGNEASKEFTFDVRHGSPVSIGPGAVDPTTGQLTLTASDVSLGGASGVTRSYKSRALTAGAPGPLGPQWAMSVGGGEGLLTLPSGNVELISGSGGTTTFTLNSKGELEAPRGDEGIKIEYRSTEHKYVLEDASAGSETVFEQPAGDAETAPQFANQFGADGVQMNSPESVAVDASGNVWVVDVGNDRVLKFSPSGTLLAAYGSYGAAAGQFIAPWGISINHTTGNVYVSDRGNYRIDELSSTGAFVKAFGWGVADGAAAFESCTTATTCRSGIAGASAGQFSVLAGVTIDSSGNVWVADYGNNRIQEFSEAGAFVRAFGSEGPAAGQLKGPTSIAVDSAGVYVADYGNNRLEEFSTAGAFVRAIGWGVTNGEAKLEVCTSGCQAGIAGAGSGQFNLPREIVAEASTGDLYVTDSDNNRVEEFTSSGAFLTAFGTTGTGEGQFKVSAGIALNANNGIYVVDYGNNRVEEWMRSKWWPTSAKGSLPAHTTYIYTSVKGAEGTVIEPYEVIQPAPTGVTCGTKVEELKDGCRALTFTYSTGTTATGEDASQWGEYQGRLSQVVFHAYNPTTKGIEEKAVARYAYDKQGRLRAEWDPRITPVLKTTYGYDAEGHVTAVTPPGQQPWAFTYGTIAGDPSTGRLLKFTRGFPKASESAERVKKKLEEGAQEAPWNALAPELTGAPAVGVRMSVSNGMWSSSTISYSYQWEDCNSAGAECSPILGASNQNYTPTATDAGHTLIATVTATNGNGSSSHASAASSAVAGTAGDYTQTVDSGYTINAISCMGDSTKCAVSDSAGKALYTTNASSTGAASWAGWSGPVSGASTAIDCDDTTLCLLADNGDLYYSAGLGGTWTEAFAPSYPVISLSCAGATFCVDGQGDGSGYIRYSTNPTSTSWTAVKIGTGNVNGIQCRSTAWCVAVENNGYVRVATSASQVESSSWTSTDIDGSTALNGIACASSGTPCVAVDSNGNVLNLSISGTGAVTVSKNDIDGTTSLASVSCIDTLTCATVDSAGNVFTSQNRGETWVKRYVPGGKLTSVSCASASLCATADTTGKVTMVNPGGPGVEAAQQAPQPGSTIEYRVPVSGAGAPNNLSAEEVEKWGQKDHSELEDNDPIEGMAIFPPDEPQSWPATGYTRATIDYLNAKALPVNTATPSGGIATTEYNSINEVTRTLGADDRALALAEGCESVKEHKCKSAEAAERLDTKTEYGAGGAQIAKLLGPEHEVKLAHGEEVAARSVTHYYYDEGAKAAEEANHETYNLVTKSTSGALLANGEEKDVRTTTTFYGGQGGLGWKLRKATSMTEDPSGLNLTTQTVYDEHTGQVVETKAPEGTHYESGGVKEYALPHGSDPFGLTVGPDGNLWFTDQGSGEVGKVTPAGTVAEYASEHYEPEGIAAGADGNLWFVEHSVRNVDHITTAGALTTYKLTRTSTSNVGIAEGADKNLWFTESATGYIGVINAKDEIQHEYALPSGSAPYGIAKGGDGNLWFAEYGTSKIGKITTTGEITEYALPAGSRPYWIAADKEGNLWFTDSGTSKIGKITTSGAITEYALPAGSEPRGIAPGPNGEMWFTDYATSEVGEITTAGAISERGLPYGSEPLGITTGPEGDVWFTEYGTSEIARLAPGAGAGAAHDASVMYYTAKGEAEVGRCQNHPEWAGMVCETGPVAQPEHGVPALPEKTVTYNIWDEPETTTEHFGSTTRTTTESYDAAGRALTSEESASPATDQALPKTTTEYNPETGAVESQSATIGGTTKTITSRYDTLGRQVEYTDAEGNKAKYVYEEGSDGRLVEESEGKGEEGASKQTYSYDATTGEMTKLVDSQAGTFTAGYDLEGKLTSEIYPNGMCESTIYNQVSEAISLKYVKSRNCQESGAAVWYSDAIVPSIHGEAAAQTSTLASEDYAYDSIGRLVEAQETPTGEGCRSRLYSYDEESDRTSETTRESSSKTCSTTGGTTETYGYDEADRLTGSGIAYETFGDVTKLPASDAGGHELTSSYYVDGQTYAQAQNGETLTYTYDPVGRTLQTRSEGKTTADSVSHYAGAGEAVTWTSEGGGAWTRNIPCLGGALCATATSGQPAVLLLHDLLGDVVATAALSESETKLLSTYNSTEFGVPQSGVAPPKYAWLGADGLSTQSSMESGLATLGGASYVPQIARDLQTAPVTPPGAYPELAPATEYVATVSPVFLVTAQEEATSLWEEAEAERQRQREIEAEEAALEAEELERQEDERIAEEESALSGGGGGQSGGKSAKGKAAKGKSATKVNELALDRTLRMTNEGGFKGKDCKRPYSIRCGESGDPEEAPKPKPKPKPKPDCNSPEASYRPGGEAVELSNGLYYGDSRVKDVSCGSDGGDPTVPCPFPFCTGGAGEVMEAWQQWFGHELSRKPNEQLLGPPRRRIRAILV